MKVARNIVIGAAVATVLAGSAGLALALSPLTHTLTVKTPDGGTAEIQYVGDVPPRISFKGAPEAVALPMDPAFVDLQRISAAMDREMDDVMSRMAAPASTLKAGGFDAGAPGRDGFTTISTENGGAYCGRSVEITQGPNDKEPKVMTRTFGNCPALGGTPPSGAGKRL